MPTQDWTEIIALVQQKRRQAVAQVAHHQEQVEEAEGLVSQCDELLAMLRERQAAEPTKSPALNAQEPEPEDSDVKTTRFHIRQVLKRDSMPKSSPDITRALIAEGVFRDYKKAKVNVDANLKRMKDAGLVEKNDAGWKLLPDQIAA